MNEQQVRQAATKYFSSAEKLVAKVPRRTWLIAGVAVLVAISALWYFTAGHNSSATKEKGSSAAPVRVATVVRGDMAVVEHTLGTVVANTLVQVTARVQGVLDAANFKEGQFVKKGDLLFQIDPRGFEAALDQSRAALLRDESLLKNANRDKQRQEELMRQGATSDQLRATAVANADALAATVALDRSAVKIAELNVSYTQIHSPVDGKTGPLLVQPGNMVVGTGATPLVTVAQVQPVKVSFNLPESDLPIIQARQRSARLVATLDLRGANGKPLVAPVDFTSNAVNNQSGTIELRATFDNADLSLVPGELVNVTVEVNNLHNALIVPRTAINDGPAGPYVYLAVKGKAVVHTVKVLFDDSKNVAIESDVKPGDQVIVEGQLRVEPNGAIKIPPAKTAAPKK